MNCEVTIKFKQFPTIQYSVCNENISTSKVEKNSLNMSFFIKTFQEYVRYMTENQKSEIAVLRTRIIINTLQL